MTAQADAQELTMDDAELHSLLARVDRMRDRPRKGARAAPDPRDGAVYETTAKIKLSVKLALITGRPLLLRGEPGSGKSSLAPYVARNLGWRYYEEVITARTEAQDLLWRFDSVRRLAHATSLRTRVLNDIDYVEPGVMWWVIDPSSARRRGALDDESPTTSAVDPFAAINRSRRSPHAVVLLDEIDKADPDVPNALLVPLGSSQFRVREIDRQIPPSETSAGPRPRTLVIVSTNEERALPQAFVRRCIVHHLDHPDEQALVQIARRHLADRGVAASTVELDRYLRLAKRLTALRRQAIDDRRRAPSTAEFLDAVAAMRDLGVDPDDRERWPDIEAMILAKDRRSGGSATRQGLGP